MSRKERRQLSPHILHAKDEASDFFGEIEGILNDLAGNSFFNFRPGNGWAIDPENGNATYDIKFFLEKGYSRSQSLFAAFHEIICHLVQTSELIKTPEGKSAYEELKQRSGNKRRLHIWDNCRTDIKGNLAIMEFAPAITSDIQRLYQEKLFPETDYTKFPLHLQFMYAILRYSMLPDEPLVLDPQVEEILNRLANIKSKSGKSVIDVMTDPATSQLDSLLISKKYIEPIVDQLFEYDKENNNLPPAKSPFDGPMSGDNQDSQATDGGENQAGDSYPENQFSEYYDDYDANRHPEPIDDQDIDDSIQKREEAIANQSEEVRQNAAYFAEHGVTIQESLNYYREFEYVRDSIERMQAIFQKIAEQRRVPKRKMVRNRRSGNLDSDQIVRGYIETLAGIENPSTFTQYEGRNIEITVPGSFSLRMVADLSSSMDGSPAIMQRRAAILFMETLRGLQEMFESGDGLFNPDLQINTELRAFRGSGTIMFKPLSSELSEKQRVEYFNGLCNVGGGTNDYDVLHEIFDEVNNRVNQDPEYAEALKEGKLREIVVVLSDGFTDQTEVQRWVTKLMDLNVTVIGIGMNYGANAIANTYAPHGITCPDINRLPEIVEQLLAEFLASLSITGNPEDIWQQ